VFYYKVIELIEKTQLINIILWSFFSEEWNLSDWNAPFRFGYGPLWRGPLLH